MSCLENIKRITYPAELVMELTKLYRFKGKDFYYEDIFKSDMQTMIKETIERETFFAARTLKLDISESRLRFLTKKNGIAKTNDEKIVLNLKNVFQILQKKGDELELNSNEFLSLAKRVFGGVKEVGFRTQTVEVQMNLLREKKRVSLRLEFEELLSLYKRLLNSTQVEATQLATNLYVDLCNIKVFDQENEFMNLLIYYCLLFKERFNVFKYISFFELYLKYEKQFENALVQAGYNWEAGFSQTAILNNITIQMLLEGYMVIEGKEDAYSFDKGLRKIDSVESSILKLGEVFRKEDIRAKNPYLSDSTINRALENLKRENKIRPNGTGRSATWMRIIEDETFDPRNKQLSIFDIDSND